MPPARRGFAAMDPEKQREIASRGGHAAQSRGTAHKLTDEERSRGGQQASQNVARMAEIGARGGIAAHEKNAWRNERLDVTGSNTGALYYEDPVSQYHRPMESLAFSNIDLPPLQGGSGGSGAGPTSFVDPVLMPDWQDFYDRNSFIFPPDDLKFLKDEY